MHCDMDIRHHQAFYDQKLHLDFITIEIKYESSCKNPQISALPILTITIKL